MEIRPLHPEFGAEILGYDFEQSASPEVGQFLHEALDRHQLLVLRSGTPFPAERQVEVASLFGPPVDNGSGLLWSVLRNEEAAGSIKLPFHQDLSYTQHPIKIITLNALDLPPGGTSTSFVSNVANWASLPADVQDRLEPMTLRHHYESEAFPDLPQMDADHPVCARQAHTGRPMLFVTENHASRIHELDAGESDAMLARLFAHSYADERIYTHWWQTHDLLIWDNLAIQHARREVADIAGGKRAVRRVVINDVSFSDLLQRVRQTAQI